MPTATMAMDETATTATGRPRPRREWPGKGAATSTVTEPGRGPRHGNDRDEPDKTGYHQLTPGEQKTWRGITVERRYTREGVDPYDTVEWDSREAAITNEHGKVVFEQKNLEFPKAWSPLATNVVASKYFRGTARLPGARAQRPQMIGRVVDTITGWGIKDAYFATDDRRGSLPRRAHGHPPQAARGLQLAGLVQRGRSTRTRSARACFINSVHDTMERILGLAKTEGMLFKYGSGTGSNLSTLRSRHGAARAAAARASGPVSLHEGLRRLRRRHQVRRQDAPRGEDGHPQRRPSGRRRVHRLQGRSRSARPGRSSTPATTATSTAATPTNRSSSRTPTTRCA